MKRKSKTSLMEAFPFALPEHLCTRDNPESKLAKYELVGRAGKTVLRRFPAAAWKVADAIEPTAEEVVQASGYIQAFRNKFPNADPAELCGIARNALVELAQQSRAGNGKALWQFAAIAADVCRGLEQMVANNPKALRPIARKVLAWPMMRSTHPRNCAPDKWLDEMELGRDMPFTLDKYSKWHTQGPATRYALALYRHLDEIRSEKIKIDGKPAKAWLPPFTRDTAPAWFDMAWKCLLASYPHPEQIAELDALVTNPGRRRSPGRRKEAIRQILRARFIAIARL